MKKISSSPIFYKRIFPIFWFGFLAFFMYAGLFENHSGSSNPLPFLVIPIVMAAFGYLFMKKLVFDLADEVCDEGDHLLIRFGNDQDEVKLANIINVSYMSMMNPPRVTLSLRQPCRFGKEVSFSPPFRWFNFFNNPVISELIERIDRARNEF